jgi:hypothetical protein
MNKTDLAVAALRVMLVVAFALLIVFQTLSLPGQFAYMAREDPGSAHLRWPMTVFAGVELLCVQVVIVCTWKLLSLVKHDRIFSEGALKWVDAIIGAIVTAWTLLLGLSLYVMVYVIRNEQDRDPGLPMLLFLLLVAGAVVWLLMVVMRALLQRATTLRAEMEAVI